jgi:magnesium chelatase family protein
VDYEKLSGDRLGETSETIRARVQAARDCQRERFSKLDAKHPIFCNADMRVGEIRQFCKLQDEGQCLMRAATSCCAWASSIYQRGAIIAREA